MKKLLVYLPLAVALTAGAAQAADYKKHYHAFASETPDGRIYGIAWRAKDPEEARRKAKAECEKAGEFNCQFRSMIEGNGDPECIAVAVEERAIEGNKIRTFPYTRAEAVDMKERNFHNHYIQAAIKSGQKALKKCVHMRKGKSECAIAPSGTCSERDRRWQDK